MSRPARFARPHDSPYIVVLAAIIICGWFAADVTGQPAALDAFHNLRMAVNLAHHGTLSLEDQAPFYPSMYREPLPPAATAVWIQATDAIFGAAPDHEYFGGARTQLVKYQNLFWIALLVASAALATRRLAGNCAWWTWPMVTVGLLVANIPLLSPDLIRRGVDSLATELVAAPLLVISSLLLASGLTRFKAGTMAACGVAFGLLSLVKAAFLYSTALLALPLIGIAVYFLIKQRDRRPLVCLAIMTLAFASTIAPWMARNYLSFGTAAIAERGGIVLAIRARKDLMTAEEYLGTFYVWAPDFLQPVVGKLIGFDQSDLMRGGRLQHLNRTAQSDFYSDDVVAEQTGQPDAAISYYRQVRAARKALEFQASASNDDERTIDVDGILQARAVETILAHPLRHLALTVPFLWRGAFTIFPILALGLLLALRSRRFDLALFTLPSLAMVGFYAGFTHYLARYSGPVTGVTAIVTIMILHELLQRRRRRAGENPGRHS